MIAGTVGEVRALSPTLSLDHYSASTQRSASATTSARHSGDLVVESRVYITVMVQHALAGAAAVTSMGQWTMPSVASPRGVGEGASEPAREK